MCWAVALLLVVEGVTLGSSGSVGYLSVLPIPEAVRVHPEWFFGNAIVHSLGTLLSVPLIAYGILRSHLFDIDLRIRRTIKQLTLAAIVVASAHLISEGADRPFSSELGNVADLLAAALREALPGGGISQGRVFSCKSALAD